MAELKELASRLRELKLEQEHPIYSAIVGIISMLIIISFLGSFILAWWYTWWWKVTITSMVSVFVLVGARSMIESVFFDI